MDSEVYLRVHFQQNFQRLLVAKLYVEYEEVNYFARGSGCEVF